MPLDLTDPTTGYTKVINDDNGSNFIFMYVSSNIAYLDANCNVSFPKKLGLGLNPNDTFDGVLNIIKDVHNRYNVILDPHSAIGFGALKKINIEGNNIVLATAHPCKFPDAIDKSIGIKPSLPNELQYIMNEKENYDIISNNINETQKYIKEKLQ